MWPTLRCGIAWLDYGRAGVILTAALIGVWIVGQQSVVQSGVGGIAESVSTRVGLFVQQVVSVPTLLNTQNIQV